jgi:hypothetical protein
LSPAPLSTTQTDDRAKRVAWASGVIGRNVASFAELSTKEAAKLIDTMKSALGQEVRLSRKSPDRDLARAYGTAGRRGQNTNEIHMVDDQTLELLDSLIVQAGLTRERFDAFLRSKSSPVRGGTIRTLQQANKAIWALRNMIRRRLQKNAG